jgi:phenylalanyl-tRNA synthetase beta chain
LPEQSRSLFTVRRQLADLDYQEVVNFSFVEAEAEVDFAGTSHPIRLLNPIASQMSVMRSQLISGLVANIRYNINRKSTRVRVFEVGAVFNNDSHVADGPLTVAGIRQSKHVAAIAYGPVVNEQWGHEARSVDFFDVKADLEALCSPQKLHFAPLVHPALHPGRSAQVLIDGAPVGFIGELHPRLQQTMELPLAPVLFEVEAHFLQQKVVPVYAEISKVPAVTRDLALLVKQSLNVQSIFDVFDEQRIGSQICRIMQHIVLFDEYRGKGLPPDEKSLAFRITMQDTHSTLQDDSIDAALSAFIDVVNKKLGATLRK